MPAHTYYLPGRKLVSQDNAAIIQRARVPRSTFHNQWRRLTTFDAGYLVPFMIDEIYPGDHMRYNVTAYVRMSTALFPIFSNQRIDTFFFFCPNRILWFNFPKFMGEQDTPGATIAYQIPRLTLTPAQLAIAGIYDQMGLPHGNITAGQTISINSLPLRAYNKIWNQWFRDQNIQDSATDNTDDGPDSDNDFALLRRAKGHDYFTSALPWPQKFTPLQTLFTGTAPVIGIGAPTNAPAAGAALNVWETDQAAVTAYPAHWLGNTANAFAMRAENANVPSDTNTPQIYADLAQATGVTINALRQAWLVQDLLERDARGGTRYVELIRSHFGVTSPDFRLQRPEYIGGGQTALNITPVAQTTPTAGGGLGALGGVGTASGQHSASYASTEHGYIIGLINVRTELDYQQGLHKFWTRLVRQDLYFPSLAGLGEQAILRQEIFCNGVDAEDEAVFGYQERWHELRTRYSEVTGMFRSTAAGNIDEWHLAQQFAPAPTLSAAFIVDQPPMDRVLAAGSAANAQQYLADIQIQRTATRPIPMFGTPASLARF